MRSGTWIAIALLFATRAAVAEPIRTWGGQSTPPAQPTEATTASGTSTPIPSGAAASTGTSAPITPSTPTSPSSPWSSAPRPSLDLDEPSAIVRSPGRVSLHYVLEGIEIRGNTSTLARVVLRYIPFRSGDTIDVDDKELELTRFRLLGTGFFRDVSLSLRRGSKRGYAVLVVNVVERNTIVVNDVWLGLSSDAEPDGQARPLTAYGGIDVSETNLAGTGITLGGAIALADRQLALRTRFANPAFLGTSWTAEAQLLYNHARDFFGNYDVLVDDPTQLVAEDYAVVTYDRFGGMIGAGHDLGISTQIFFDYRLEKIDAALPLAASDHRGLDIVPIDFFILPGSSILSTLRTTLVHDTRDEPILPTRGNYLTALVEASLTPLGSDYPYSKMQLHASHWTTLPWGHVLRLEGFVGAIFGSAPLFEKYYVGDFTDLLPDRVLDLNFDRRAAPNFLNTDIVEVRYGQYAAKAQAEYRVPIYRGSRSVYGVDLFASAGVYGVADADDLTNPPRGYSGFSKVPIDLTFNFGLRADTAVGGVLLGFSNLIGFSNALGSGQ